MIRFEITLPWAINPDKVNLYLLEGDPLTLVDTGPCTPATWEALKSNLAAHGYQLSDIRQVIVTHTHIDHCGLAARIAAHAGAEVLAHPEAAPHLAHSGTDREKGLNFLFETLLRSGVPEKPLAKRLYAKKDADPLTEPVGVSRTVDEGDLVTRGAEAWEVIHLPGHAPGLIGLYRPETAELITSDHLLADTNSRPILYMASDANNGSRGRYMPAYLASLERVAEMTVTTAWPAHGEPIHQARDLALAWIARHREQANWIALPLQDGPKTAYQVWQAHFPRILPLDPVNGLVEVITYLDLLEAEERVHTFVENDLIYYRLPEIIQPGTPG